MNKIGSAFVAAALVLATTIIAMPTAQANGCIFANFGGGNGTAGNPLQVATAAHLTELRGDSRCWEYFFLQTADISMGGVTWSSGIGGTFGSVPGTFDGTYDGGGHAISDLNITVPGGTYVGLFTRLSATGTLRNLSFGGNVSAEVYVGGLVGQNLGTIENSFVGGSAVITATGGAAVYPGGLAGLNGAIGRVLNSYSAASIVSPLLGAGLVGNHAGTITNSYSVGNVTGSSPRGLTATGTGVVNDSFWDTQTSGAPTSEGGTGKTTEEMTTLSTFTGWSISAGWSAGSTWGICSAVNSGYPFLTVFYSADPCSGSPEPTTSTTSAPVTYSFTFNTSNGGACFPAVTVTRGQNFTLPDASVSCTPEGTRLVGWSIPNQAGGNFSAGGTVSVSGSQTFTAVAENNRIAITYDPNIGYTFPGSTNLVPCLSPTGLNLHTSLNSTWFTQVVSRSGNLAMTPSCTPAGATFVGWSDQPTASGYSGANVFSPGAALPTAWSAPPNPVNTIHLYAVWR